MKMLTLYAKKKFIDREIFSVEVYAEKECVNKKIYFDWSRESKPDKRNKYIMYNCFRYNLVWVE